MSRYGSIVGFPYSAGIGPYNFDSFIESVTVISENNAPNPTVNIVVQTHGIKTDYPLFWSTEAVTGTIEAGHFTDNTLTGSFNVDGSGVATITRTARADSATNGLRVFKIVIRLGNATNGGVMTKSVSITMNDTSLTPLTATLNSAVPNPIVQVINVPSQIWELFSPAVTGGRGSAYAYAAPSLPTNIGSVDPVTGRLSGTPTVTSTTPTSYTVNVTQNYDPAIPFQFAQPASISFNMAVASTLTAARKDVADGETRWLPPNTTITPFIPVQASGGWTGSPAGTLPYNYTFTLNSIPAGLSFNSAIGEITGSASATNSLTYNVRVQDNATTKQQTSGIQFTMRVATVKATIVNLDNRIFVRGTPIAFKPITYTSTAPTASHTMTGDNGISMNTVTGVISGTPTAVQASKLYTVTIRDICQPFQEIATTFNMGFCAVLTTSGNVSANRYVAVNSTIISFTPVTPSGGHAPLTRAITSPALRGTLTMDTSGLVFGVAPATVDSSMITYTMTTTDSSTGSTVTPTRQVVTNTFKLQVVSELVATVTTPSRIVVINTNVTSLNYFPVTAGSTGSPIKTYVIKVGTTALPNGLTLTTAGQVTGIPTVATSPQTLITYRVTISDECLPQQSVEPTFTLAIAPLLVVSIVKSIVYLKVSTATSVPIASITGGWAPLTVTPSVTLPGTLVISTSGVLSGSASATINSIGGITINVQDFQNAIIYPGRQNKTTATSFTISTVAALTASVNISNRIFPIGTAIASYRPLNVSGGGGVISYSASLPPGLILSPTNIGFIQGTPSGPVSNTSYTITLSDQSSPMQSTTGSTSIQIVTVLTTTVNTIPVLTEGVAFTAFTPVTGNGGTTTKVYSISPALPSGLTFNTATGQIAAGTPSVTGVRSSQSYTVRVIDQCSTPQDVTSAPFTITVRAVAQRIFTGIIPNRGTNLPNTVTYNWTVPPGVTSISMVCVGGAGGRGGLVSSGGTLTGAVGGGGGGALAYRNDIAVTPGSTVTVVAGATGLFGSQGFDGFAGGNSTVTVNGVIVCNAGAGQGGKYSGSTSVDAVGGAGGVVNVGVGGAGGKGGNARGSGVRGGGGGAGGYSGAGGAGGPDISGSSTNGFAGTGGGGGGSSGFLNAAGGGVGLLGAGANGAGGVSSGGGGGSGGTNGGAGFIAGTGVYGGGNIGDGAVRIMWGPGRAYPSTGTADQFF